MNRTLLGHACSIARAIGAVIALGVLLSTSAHAQAVAAPPPAGAASGFTTLKPVLVQGKRDSQDIRSEETSLGVLGDLKLLETPFSVNVLTRQLLENQQAQTYLDYFKNDPSFTFGNVPVGFASLRGFSVGVDGYLFDGMSGNLGLSDGRYQIEGVERIEVLKGPSTFLYGLGQSSSVGGAINFIPKRPPNEPIRQVEVGYTTRSLFSVLADLGDRFGADRQFGYRLNLGYRDGEQAFKNADWTHQALTLALDWRVTPDLLLEGGYEYAKNHLPSLQPFFLVGTEDVPKAPNAHRNVAQPWDNFKAIGTTAWLRGDWKVAPDWMLTVQGQRSTDDRPRVTEARFGAILDADGTTMLFPSIDDSRDRQNTIQASLHGKAVVGGLENRLTFSAVAQRAHYSFGSTSLDPVFTNIYDPIDAEQPLGSNPDVGLATKLKASSLLATDILKLSEQWSLLGGLRYAKLKDSSYDPATGELTESHTTSKTIPIAAVMWKPSPNSLLYLNYAEGLEQGGAASISGTDPRRLPPIVTKQYEIGGKLETAGVTITGALFDIRKPLEQPDPENPDTLVQSGKQRHRGAEVSIAGQLTRELAITTGVMLLSPKISGTNDPATEGNRPIGVPKVSASVWADYRIAAVPGLFVNGGVYYTGNQYADAANTQKVPSWTRVDLGGRFETRLFDRPAAILLAVENVADRSYWTGAQTGILTLAEPRTVKVTGRFSF